MALEIDLKTARRISIRRFLRQHPLLYPSRQGVPRSARPTRRDMAITDLGLDPLDGVVGYKATEQVKIQNLKNVPSNTA